MQQGLSGEECDKLDSQEEFELTEVDDDISALETEYLVENARKLLLPIPEYRLDGAMWKRSKHGGNFILTENGIAEIRNAIRKERRERREGTIVWLASLTGIVGAVTGLVTVLKSCGSN